MCIDLYVDKVLVYTDCVPVPSVPSPEPNVPNPEPSVPSPELSVPSPEPSVPSPVPSVPSPYAINTPSSIARPETNVIIDGYSLITPSSMPIMNTIMSPSSSNSSNMSMPFARNGSEFIQEQGWMSIAIVVTATVLPALLICILVYKKKPRKCKNSNKVQPENLKKKQCCKCCKKEPQLPVKQDRSTTTGTYLNQPPLPLSSPPTSR